MFNKKDINYCDLRLNQRKFIADCHFKLCTDMKRTTRIWKTHIPLLNVTTTINYKSFYYLFFRMKIARHIKLKKNRSIAWPATIWATKMGEKKKTKKNKFIECIVQLQIPWQAPRVHESVLVVDKNANAFQIEFCVASFSDRSANHIYIWVVINWPNNSASY